jgi:two-component system, NarL family, invasion response regulator UvrY
MGDCSSIRVLLADDHPLLIAGFAMALKGLGVEVVGQARTPGEAIDQFRSLRPDVLVLDIRFGGRSTGLDAAKAAKAEFPDAKIIFLSQFDADSLITEGYRGYAFITKDCNAADLAAAINKANNGETYFLPAIAERLAILTIKGDRSPQTVLDDKELEIFRRLARGLTQSEIAEEMKLSLKTISVTTQSIKDKLGVRRPADITLLAVKHDMLRPDGSD